MKTKIMLCGAFAAITVLAAPRAELTFADVSSVKIEDAFWSPRYALWRGTTIPDVLEKLEMRSHVAANLELAAKGAKGGHRGAYFFDGLLCESLRGASDYLAAKPDAALEAKIDRFADLIAAAQRLLAVAKSNEGVSNKALAKFADQINSLADKWERK